MSLLQLKYKVIDNCIGYYSGLVPKGECPQVWTQSKRNEMGFGGKSYMTSTAWKNHVVKHWEENLVC